MFCCFVHSSPHFTTTLGQVDQVLRLDPRSSSDPAGCCPSQSGCVLPSRVCVLLLCPSQSGVCPLFVSFPVGVCPLAVSFPVGVCPLAVSFPVGVFPSQSGCVLPSRSVSFPVGVCPSQSGCALLLCPFQSGCVLPSRGVSSCCVLPSRGVSFPVGVCPSQSGCVLLLCPSQSGVCPLAVSFPVGCVSSCCVLPSRAHRKSPQIHILPSNRRPTLWPGVSTRSVHRAARSSSTVRAAWRSQHLLHTV